MGQHDIVRPGYPRSNTKRDWTVIPYCGGSGAGTCGILQTATSVKYPIDINPFCVYNRKLVLNSSGEFAIYIDGGPDGSGCEILGAEVQTYLGLSVDGVLTDAQIMAQNIPLPKASTAPYDLAILASKLPQPTNASWANKIWIHLYWGSTAYIGAEVFANNIQYLRVVKHDFDVRQ